jgi:hypothetical protein
MATRRLRARGSAEPALAWRRYLEIDAWRTWSPHIVSVDADASRIAVGVTGWVHVVGGLRVPFAITAVDPERLTWSWVARLGPVRLTLHHAVRVHPRGSATDLVMEGPDAVLLAYAPLAWVALRRLVAR